VERRDADKAGIPDDVEQDFHPDGHEQTPLSIGNSRDATFVPDAANMAYASRR
jgi:hypothetical protein